MAVLIDTNVVLDWLLEREPFSQQAKQIMEACIRRKFFGFLASHTLLNIFYIVRKHKTVQERKEIILMLCDKFTVVGINEEMIVSAVKNDAWADLEDGLQMQCALDSGVDCIVTRDPKGFESSKIKIFSPASFIDTFLH